MLDEAGRNVDRVDINAESDGVFTKDPHAGNADEGTKNKTSKCELGGHRHCHLKNKTSRTSLTNVFKVKVIKTSMSI